MQVARNALNRGARLRPLMQVRRYCYDKRGYIPLDDYAISLIKPWSYRDLLWTTQKIRRFMASTIWFHTILWCYCVYRVAFWRRANANHFEKQDFIDKYWRDGYWISEFPEGLT